MKPTVPSMNKFPKLLVKESICTSWLGISKSHWSASVELCSRPLELLLWVGIDILVPLNQAKHTCIQTKSSSMFARVEQLSLQVKFIHKCYNTVEVRINHLSQIVDLAIKIKTWIDYKMSLMTIHKVMSRSKHLRHMSHIKHMEDGFQCISHGGAYHGFWCISCKQVDTRASWHLSKSQPYQVVAKASHNSSK